MILHATTYDRGFKSFYKGTLSDILPQLKGINEIFCMDRDYWVATIPGDYYFRCIFQGKATG